MIPLDKTLLEFLSIHHKGGPLLLALSGGGDSMALFYALLRLKIGFEVVHLDHGWRSESADEALYLRDLTKQESIPFHFKKKENETFSKNLEEDGRLFRLQFFREVAANRKAEGILLAHHAGDLAEGVLKRVLEGMRLSKLDPLKPVSTVEGLRLLRPWLFHEKEELIDSLGEKSYFEDATNYSEKFLRGRFRKTIIPHLSTHFGKRVEGPLVRLAEESRILEDYLDHQIQPYLKEVVRKESKLILDLKKWKELPHAYELNHLLEHLLKEMGAVPRKKEISQLISYLKENSTEPRKRKVCDIEVLIHNKIVTLCSCHH